MEKFFNAAFKGYEVPTNIKNASMEICKQYKINGVTDPMYISNVIANELGIGDGAGNFYNSETNKDNIEGLAERLVYAYKTCIKNSGVPESKLKDIIVDNV